MVAPAAAMLSAAGTSLVVSAVVGPITDRMAADRVSECYRISLNSWRRHPEIPPGPGPILSAFNHGYLSEELARTVLRNQGINWRFDFEDPRTNNHDKAWEAVRKDMLVRPTVGFLMDVWARGYWGQDAARARDAVKLAGGDYDVLKNYVETMWVQPSLGDVTEAVNREFITPERYGTYLRRLGYGADESVTLLNRLRDRLPGPSDVIHMAVKEAFSVDIANQLKLYDEFPRDITPFMKGAGLNWGAGFRIVANGEQRDATIADLYWASHWQPISPQQAIGMFHVCRANRLARFAAAGVNVSEFTIEDVKKWLRINDYPPTVREQLVSLSFTPLRLVDIRKGLSLFYTITNSPETAESLPVGIRTRLENLNREWGVEQFRDRGVLPDDAQRQVDMVFADAALKRAQPIIAIEKGVTRKAFRTLCDLYRKGVYDRQEAERLLLRLGLRPAAVGVYLDAEEKVFQLDRLNKVLAALRRAFFGGGVNADQAIESLVNSGIVERRARDYVSMWSVESSISRRHATTEKILGWVAKGGMTAVEARERLVNLGWDDPDLRLLLVEAQSKLITLQGRAMKAADSDRRRRAADLLKVQRDLERQAKLVQDAIKRQTPVGTLQRMYRKGLYNSSQFIARMLGMGYLPDVAERYRRDAIDTVSIPTLQRWLRKREITEDVFLRHLVEKGVDTATAQKYATDALTPEPQKLYPKPPPGFTTSGTATLPTSPPPSPPPPPPQPAPTGASVNETATQQLHTQPEQLNTQPEQLHTLPRQLGANNQGG